MIPATLAVLFWIACGVLGYGFTFKYFRTEYHMLTDKRTAIIVSLSGPIGLLSSFMCGLTKHGLGWRE